MYGKVDIRPVQKFEALVSVLPRCPLCGGAFYPDSDPVTWLHTFCNDCWEEGRDVWEADYEAYRMDRPVEYICHSPYVEWRYQ